MKGLARIPSQTELAEAYARLQQPGVNDVSPSELSLWSQWSRFDPRLGELWVEWVAREWESVSARALNDEILKQPWPAALGVLLEQVATFSTRRSGSRAHFERWMAWCLSGVVKESGFPQFFIGLRAFAGKEMFDDARFALTVYREWGFLGREVLVNKALARIQPGKLTLLTLSSRRAMMEEMAQSGEHVTVESYMAKLGGWVSRRQAQRDLKGFKGLTPRGRTRGRFYSDRRRG